MQSNNSARPRSAALQRHKQLADLAYKSVSSGIDAETHQPPQFQIALDHYRKGIQLIEEALNVQFSNPEERRTAEGLNIKLQNNLAQTRERVEEISSKVISTKLAEAPRSPSAIRKPSPSAPRPSYLRKSSASTATASKSAKPKNEGLKNVDTAMCDKILNEVLVNKPNVTWDDIVGLESAKQALREIVILPTLRPELFTGLRSPARGVLLFGPPGTGKTMLAKAVAHESKCTFFSISASTLTSKFVGEGEKMVRALFAVARNLSPSIIFIDEIDSILTERSESEHEASRRLKTEFLLQFDGIGNNPEERLLVMGATNKPSELDEAAIRRLVKRIYIPLPEPETRTSLIEHLLQGHEHTLGSSEKKKLVDLTEGYSGSDITALAREASLGPIRSLGAKLMSVSSAQHIRPINLDDFIAATRVIRPSVTDKNLLYFQEWNKQYGTLGS